MPTRVRCLLATAAVCAAALALAAPASAITFGPSVTVNGPDTRAFQSPAVAVNAAGDVVIAWSDIPGGVYASFRPRGGSFSRPQLLSGRRVEGTDLSAAISVSGEAFVAWAENETLAALGRARARVVVSVRAPGASRFGGRQELSLGQAGAEDPDLGVTPSGEAVAVWEELRLNPRGVRTDPLRVSSAIRPLGGAWSAPQLLSEDQRRFMSGVSAPGRNPMVPRVSVLPSGAALAVWERASGLSTTCCQRVEAAVRPAGGAFGPALTLTEAVDRGLAVVTDAKGGRALGRARLERDRPPAFRADRDGRLRQAARDPGNARPVLRRRPRARARWSGIGAEGRAALLRGALRRGARRRRAGHDLAAGGRPVRPGSWGGSRRPARVAAGGGRGRRARDLQLGSAPPLGPRRAGADRLRHRRPEAVRRGWRARRGSRSAAARLDRGARRLLPDPRRRPLGHGGAGLDRRQPACPGRADRRRQARSQPLPRHR